MKKQLPLTDSVFDGDIQGPVFSIPRRIVLLHLLDGRHILETKWDRLDKQCDKGFLIAVVVAILVFSAIVVTSWTTWDKAERSTISQIYHGSAKDVEKNKAAAFQKLDIAGAGSDNVNHVRNKK